ncbi:MAG: hypothetical protein AB1758_32330 [Candidatus Eremiobacterota bacterium]
MAVASTLADLSGLDQQVGQVTRRVAEQGHALVVGASGTGRSTLARRVVEATPGAFLIDLPPPGAEGALHGLLQLASEVSSVAQKQAVDSSLSILERTRLVCRSMEESRVPVVVVPQGWGRRMPDEAEPFARQQQELPAELAPVNPDGGNGRA